MTPVVFRKFKDGDVIALFPTEVGNLSAAECMSYMHVGQHSSADINLVVCSTRLASVNEYGALLNELYRRGYKDLKVFSRIQRWMDDQRADKIRTHIALANL